MVNPQNPPNPSIEDMRAFSHRHGLGNLTSEQLARMAELAAYVGALGQSLPRPPRKEDAPAPTFEVRRGEWR